MQPRLSLRITIRNIEGCHVEAEPCWLNDIQNPELGEPAFIELRASLNEVV